jgi:hypothetical protein
MHHDIHYGTLPMLYTKVYTVWYIPMMYSIYHILFNTSIYHGIYQEYIPWNMEWYMCTSRWNGIYAGPGRRSALEWHHPGSDLRVNLAPVSGWLGKVQWVKE